MDRRDFLKSGVAVLVTAGLSPWLVASSGAPAGAGGFSKAEFQALLHTWFHVGGPAWQPMELVDVRDGLPSLRAEQFTLVFRGSPVAPLDEGTYTVAPPQGSAFELFLQPAGGDAAGPTYAATFSLLQAQGPSCAPAA